MPRAARKDVLVTKCLRANGYFKDSRSFISLPDIKGVVHVFLYGEEDKGAMRLRIHDKAKGKCQLKISPQCRPFPGFSGEWDHAQDGSVGRCDCIHNGRWVCYWCHQMRHSNRTPQFTPGLNAARKEAAAEFEKLYPKQEDSNG